jgi:hypothetical protein
MQLKFFRICVPLVALFLCSPLLAQQPTTRPVTFVVRDERGSYIVGARFHLTPAPESLPAHMETGTEGRLTLDLKPGKYELVVSEPRLDQATLQIEVGAPSSDTNAALLVPIVLHAFHGELEVTSSDFAATPKGPTPVLAVYPENSLLLSADDMPESLALSQADFRALPHETLTIHRPQQKGADETYSGVPLTTLLAKLNAPLAEKLRGKALASYIVATGSDEYSVVFSIAELDTGFRDGTILVADTRNNQPLGKNGPYQLIITADKRPARWVHNLVEISLHEAH